MSGNAVFHSVFPNLTTYDNRQKVLELTADDELTLTLPNFDGNEHKEVFLEITYLSTGEVVTQTVPFGGTQEYWQITDNVTLDGLNIWAELNGNSLPGYEGSLFHSRLSVIFLIRLKKAVCIPVGEEHF